MPKSKRPKSALGKKWYHNAHEENLYHPGTAPEGWCLGRLPGRQDGPNNPMWSKEQSMKDITMNTADGQEELDADKMIKADDASAAQDDASCDSCTI
jgi:hypothetical protein